MTDRSIAALLFCAAMPPGVAAQHWVSLGDVRIQSPGSPVALYGDSVYDRLFMGGTMKALIMPDEDTLVVNSLASWNGAQWDSLGSGTACGDGNFCSQMYWFLRYEDDLYVNGGFSFIEPGDSISQHYFARIAGPDMHLEGVTCHEHSWNDILTIVPTVTNDTLYFTGYRDSLCGLAETNVFAYDGENFQRWAPYDDWPTTQGDYVGSVFKFRDQFYMTGLLYDSVSNTTMSLGRYNTDHWEHLPGFETPAPIKNFLIHNDTLYLCGFFYEGPGIPGNMVVAYDGENWNNLGGGITFDDQGTELGIVYDLEWWHGKLLACGQFHRAGGEPIEHIAQWDGHHWCGSGGDFEIDNAINRMAIWRDSLYVVGGFDSVDGVSIHRVAKWDGGDFDAVCSPDVGLAEQHAAHDGLDIRRLDRNRWSLYASDDAILTIHDLDGRLLYSAAVRSEAQTVIDLSAYASSLFLVRLCKNDGTFRSARIATF